MGILIKKQNELSSRNILSKMILRVFTKIDNNRQR